MPKVEEKYSKVPASLDRLMRLSIIALALAGIYYLVIFLPSRSTIAIPDEQFQSSVQSNAENLAMKQKCADAGYKFYEQYKEQYSIGDNTSIFNQGTAYSQELGTCLVEINQVTSDYSKTPSFFSRYEWVFDAYSGRPLASYSCLNDECKKGDMDYQIQKNGLMEK